MNHFSVPSDFKDKTIERLSKLNRESGGSKVIEVYGQITEGGFKASGRITDMVPKVTERQLIEHISVCEKNGIGFNYVLNPACTGNAEFNVHTRREISSFARMLIDYGVRRFTLTSPALVELILSIDSKAEIKISAINEINAPLKSLFYKNLGAKRIVADPDINRDFNKLKNIASTFGGGVEVIVNILCYRDCAYKMFHYSHESHCETTEERETITSYFFNRCYLQKAAAPENLLKINWIRPEDLHLYNRAGIYHFKIQGRQNIINGDIVKCLKAYFNGSYNGNLMDLITIFNPYNSFQPYIENKKLNGFLEPFFNTDNFCSQICGKCRHCLTYSHICMNIRETEDLNNKARLFYSGIDRYAKAIGDN